MSTTKPGIKKYVNREAGLVSIMVTMILMIVISLLVIGFAQISRRNSRQALDEQLSTQAFYAAETGINDAAQLVRDAINSGEAVPAKEECGAGTGAVAAFYGGLDSVLDADAGVEYTCLMVDPAPPTLNYSDVGTTGIVVPLMPESGTFSTLTLTWQTKEDTTTPLTNCPTAVGSVFVPAASWQCGYGVLRFDLVDTSGALTSSSLQNQTMTSFLVPLASGGVTSIPYAASNANTNTRVGVDCSNSSCTMTITGLSSDFYYMRINSLYKDVSLQIEATNSSGPVDIEGAQALIDATGKAQDVLRRIQVYVPLTDSSQNQMSDYAIQSYESLCKRFSVMSGFFENSVAGVVSDNPLCTP